MNELAKITDLDKEFRRRTQQLLEKYKKNHIGSIEFTLYMIELNEEYKTHCSRINTSYVRR